MNHLVKLDLDPGVDVNICVASFVMPETVVVSVSATDASVREEIMVVTRPFARFSARKPALRQTSATSTAFALIGCFMRLFWILF